MKIHFSGVNFSSTSGPNSFAQRLAKQFTEMGHDIVAANDPHDIWLCFIEPSSYPWKGAKTVLRLDGVWMASYNYHLNLSIKDAYKKVDDVIIQTNFDKTLITRFFGDRNNINVIGNGIDLSTEVDIIKKSDDQTWFVSSSNWHGQKRLKSNVKLFQHIRKQITDKECTLYVLGNGAEQEMLSLTEKQKENVVLLGHQSHKNCLSIYKTSDWFIHLAFLDHFPNVLAEGLSQLCPVIYASDGGGTREVVKHKNNGLVVDSSKQFDYTLVDYENPEKEGYVLDIESFVLPSERPVVDPSHLDIRVIAEKYISVFQK